MPNRLFFLILVAIILFDACTWSKPTHGRSSPRSTPLERRRGYPSQFYTWTIFENYAKYLKTHSSVTKSDLGEFTMGRSLDEPNAEVYKFEPEECGNEWELEVLNELDSGGFGTVYDAVLFPDKGEEDVAVKKTKRGAWDMLHGDQLRKKIQSPGVPEVKGSFWIPKSDGAKSGTAFSVMPLITGGDLEGWMKSFGKKIKSMSTDQIWKTVDQNIKELLQIMVAVHGAGVYHRDLKPENIMLSGTQFMIIDFDMATEEETSTDYAKGTLTYNPPEKVRMIPYSPKKGDVFAMGLIYLYMRFPLMARSERDLTWMFLIEPKTGLVDLTPVQVDWVLDQRFGEDLPDDRRELLSELLCMEGNRLTMEQFLQRVTAFES